MNAPDSVQALPPGWWKRVRHDLRSAVSPMRMAVQLLRSGRISAGERDEALSVIDRQIEHLLAAVDDVGDLLHAQDGGLAFASAPQDLNLLPDVVCGRGTLMRELGSRKLSLRCEPCAEELLVDHDPRRLSALLEFLLLRMAAHAGAGAELVLTVRHDDGQASLRLSGGGPSLESDIELQYLQGNEAGVGDPGLRLMLMRQLLRSGAMRLQFDGEGALRLHFAA